MWLRVDKFGTVEEAYFETLGRALVLAQNFEHNCKQVLVWWDLGRALQQGEISTLDEMISYSDGLMERFLGKAVRRFGDVHEVTKEELDLLSAAKDARNYVAHQSSWARIRTSANMELIAKELSLFRDTAEALAAGDNLVSGWSYMIQEKSYPPHSQRSYCSKVVTWVLSPLSDMGVEF